MELPHLSLYIRRALRRPSTGTTYILVLWAAMFAARFTSGNQIILPAYYWLSPFDLGTLCILLGNFVLYFVIAQQMNRLVHGEDGRPPDWYATPLNDSAAVSGALATTGLASLLPLALLVTFMVAHSITISTDWSEYGPALWFSLIRLPQFALMAACLQLASRLLVLARLLPLMLALTATLVSFWDVTLVYQYQYVPVGASSPAWALTVLMLGLASIVLLQWWLARLAQRTAASIAHYLAVCVMLLIPAVIALGKVVDMYSGLRDYTQVGFAGECLLNAVYSYMYVDLTPFVELSFYEVPPQAAFMLYGWTATRPATVLVLTAAYVIALALWWLAACRCLRAARTSDASSR